MAKKTIAHVGFRYRQPVLDKDGKPVKGPNGDPLYTFVVANKGETVEIPLAEDVALGEKYGAFETPAKKGKDDADADAEAEA